MRDDTGETQGRLRLGALTTSALGQFRPGRGQQHVRHVGCTPKSGSKIRVVVSVVMGRGELMMPPGA